jgi:7-cyano-7-deazaguanine synthase
MKAIVLLSGGVDSSTCLALAKQSHEKVIAVTIDYGQTHKREIEAAKKVAEYYEVEKHIILDLKNIFKNSHSSLNRESGLEITTGDYKNQKNINTEVEFRNGIFLTIMAGLGLQYDADYIYYGAHKDDSGAIYADCSDEFIDSIKETILIGTRKKVELITPFKNNTKDEIVKLGLKLQVPYNLTYSCYKGTWPPCGECGTCIDRKKAFKKNGIEEKY